MSQILRRNTTLRFINLKDMEAAFIPLPNDFTNVMQSNPQLGSCRWITYRPMYITVQHYCCRLKRSVVSWVRPMIIAQNVNIRNNYRSFFTNCERN